jgi:hypothetical protein
VSAFDRIRDALTGGPTYTRPAGPQASTREREKNQRQRTREARQAADRRRRHRKSVFRNGDAGDGTKFAFEETRRFGRRR